MRTLVALLVLTSWVNVTHARWVIQKTGGTAGNAIDHSAKVPQSSLGSRHEWSEWPSDFGPCGDTFSIAAVDTVTREIGSARDSVYISLDYINVTPDSAVSISPRVFELAPGASQPVRLVVYDILGREVAVLVDERKAPGSYSVEFDASGLASGVYVYRMVAGTNVASRKMVLMK